MSDTARRPSCLIEGTHEYEIVQAGERYFDEHQTHYGYVRRVIRWILDDTDYYGSTVRDIRMMLRTMAWDGYHSPEFKDQLTRLDEYIEIIFPNLPEKAKNRAYLLRGERQLFGSYESLQPRRPRPDTRRDPNSRTGW